MWEREGGRSGGGRWRSGEGRWSKKVPEESGIGGTDDLASIRSYQQLGNGLGMSNEHLRGYIVQREL